MKKKQFVNIVDIILKLMSLFWDCWHDFEIDHIILKLMTLFVIDDIIFEIDDIIAIINVTILKLIIDIISKLMTLF